MINLNGIENIEPPTRLFLIPYASSYLNSNNEETKDEVFAKFFTQRERTRAVKNEKKD